jgi:capsular polysaccharide biosynthesis protein
MTFAEEVGAYRFRLLGPRFRPAGGGRYRLPRHNGISATVLESPQLVLDSNNVDFGAMEPELKVPLRELSAISETCGLTCAAVLNAAVRHMPEELAFVATGVGGGFMLLAGMLGNDRKTCVGIDDFSGAPGARDAFRARFDARRSRRHSFFEGSYGDYLGSEAVPPIGVFLHDAGHSHEYQLEALRAAEPYFAEDCLIVVDHANSEASRQAMLDFVRDSRLSWRVLLDERTAAARHPTLWNGLMVLEAGGADRDSPLELGTETRLVDPVEVGGHEPRHHPPRVTVLHYRNPWVGVQDYPALEIIGLKPGTSVREAFESSTGEYVVVLDPDVELSSNAFSEAVREAEGAVRRSPPGGVRRDGDGSRRHRPLAQGEYFPSWAHSFDDGHDPQTVTVARALSVDRDNLVALDLDPLLVDKEREIELRFAPGLRLEGPAARCSRVPGGVVAGRVGAVLTPDGGWLVESVGAVTRAWPGLALDDRGRVELTEAPRESDERVATVACELRRAWWTENFGHWTFDVLTRVAMLLRAGLPDDVKLLIPEPVLPFHRETLAGLGIADHRIVAWDGRPTRFRTVYVPTARPAPPFLFPAGVELLRELGAGGHEAAPGRRLFVSRRQLGRTTRIANEGELLEVATTLGFVEVTPETLPYSEQLRLFSEAEVVAGAHGSGLANAIFMARGTGMCELAPARLHAQKLPNFWNLAACGRQWYGVCVGNGRRVDPKRFKRVLRDVVRAATKRSVNQRAKSRQPSRTDRAVVFRGGGPG